MLGLKTFILQSPERNFESSVPAFTQKRMGEASEDKLDEQKILVDKDETGDQSVTSTVARFNNTDTSLDVLEDLPGDFMRGEIDVKDQMDMAASAMDSSLRGLQNQSDENSPRGELGASFRDTPGGLEEVAAKTDEYLASHRSRKGKRSLKGF